MLFNFIKLFLKSFKHDFSNVQFADVAYQYLDILKSDEKPEEWANLLLRQFRLREIEIPTNLDDITLTAFLPALTSEKNNLMRSSNRCESLSAHLEGDHGNTTTVDTIFIDVGSFFNDVGLIFDFPQAWFAEFENRGIQLGVIVTSAEHEIQYKTFCTSEIYKYFRVPLIVRYSMKREQLVGMTNLAVQMAHHSDEPHRCLLVSHNVHRRTFGLTITGMQAVPNFIFARNALYKEDLKYVIFKLPANLPKDNQEFLKANVSPLLFTNLGQGQHEWLVIAPESVIPSIQKFSLKFTILKGNPRFLIPFLIFTK